LEKQLLEALEQEAETPSGDNLAETPDDPRAMRNREDSATGQRITEFFAKRLFIADMNRKGRRVLRIIDPRSGSVIWGAPFSRAS
jgi:hypothetical protein